MLRYMPHSSDCLRKNFRNLFYYLFDRAIVYESKSVLIKFLRLVEEALTPI